MFVDILPKRINNGRGNLDNITNAFNEYLKMMSIIKLRYNSISEVLKGEKYKTPYSITQVEFCALQIRKILESIAYGSLVVNKDLYRAHFENIEAMWNGKLILNDMRRVNPKFYPEPIIIDHTKNIDEFVTKSDGFLTEEEFIKIYDNCGKLLHSNSPFQHDKDIKAQYELSASLILVWCAKINGLLNTHLIHLADQKTMFYVFMESEGSQYPSGNIFQVLT